MKPARLFASREELISLLDWASRTTLASSSTQAENTAPSFSWTSGLWSATSLARFPCAARAWHGRGLVCYARSSEGKEASSWRKSRYQAQQLICPPYGFCQTSIVATTGPARAETDCTRLNERCSEHVRFDRR